MCKEEIILFPRYTPSQQGVAFNSGAKQRIIRMVEAQRDPMEPPKFKLVHVFILQNHVTENDYLMCSLFIHY